MNYSSSNLFSFNALYLYIYLYLCLVLYFWIYYTNEQKVANYPAKLCKTGIAHNIGVKFAIVDRRSQIWAETLVSTCGVSMLPINSQPFNWCTLLLFNPTTWHRQPTGRTMSILYLHRFEVTCRFIGYLLCRSNIETLISLKKLFLYLVYLTRLIARAPSPHTHTHIFI